MCIDTMTWHVRTKSAHMHKGIEFLGSSTHAGEERVNFFFFFDK